jgi:hypothetical protein
MPCWLLYTLVYFVMILSYDCTVWDISSINNKERELMRAFNIFQIYQYFTIYRRYLFIKICTMFMNNNPMTKSWQNILMYTIINMAMNIPDSLQSYDNVMTKYTNVYNNQHGNEHPGLFTILWQCHDKIY